MKRCALLAFVALLVGCAVPVRVVNEGPSASHRFGAAVSQTPLQWAPLTAIVGVSNSTTTIWDTTAGGTQSGRYGWVQRYMIIGYCDQAITISQEIQIAPSTTWIAAAGSNATAYSFPASTTTELDQVGMGTEMRVRATTTTAPGSCILGIALFDNGQMRQ